jgi:hypothetical protein
MAKVLESIWPDGMNWRGYQTLRPLYHIAWGEVKQPTRITDAQFTSTHFIVQLIGESE